MTSKSLFQNTVVLKSPGVAIFAEIIKIMTIFFFFKSLNTREKLKELEIIYQKTIRICIS